MRNRGKLATARERRYRSNVIVGLLSLTTSCLVGIVACTSGLGNKTNNVSPEANVPSANSALGFDPGVALTAPVTDTAIAAALIPGAGGRPDRELLFFAFSTAAAADNADGAGQPLVRNIPAPVDTNGVADVFVAALENTVSGGAPAAFSQALVNTFRDQRCQRCHGFHESPTAVPNHLGGYPGTNDGCADCHSPSVTGGIAWRAPFGLDFRNKTNAELCAMLMAFPGDIVEHLKTDDLIQWAIDRATVPMSGAVAAGGPASVSLEQWDQQIDAWAAGGFECSTASSVRDIVLVSQAQSGATSSSGNADSATPSVVYVSNASFDPNNPAATNPAGTLFVAFTSRASNLRTAPAVVTNADIYRAVIDVFVDEDPSGAPTTQAINLELRPAATFLVSSAIGAANSGGNGDSAAPVIAENGARIAFQSRATNFIAGFVDHNGADASDIFLHDLIASSRQLVSRSSALGPTEGANGTSLAPAISVNGAAIAFESDASDIVATADSDGVRDIYYAALDVVTGAPAPLVRASLQTGGAQAMGGGSRHASIYRDPLTARTLIAFESNKRNLVAANGALPETNIYLHDSDGARTLLVSRQPNGSAANARSLAPSFSPTGDALAFHSFASNIDGVRPKDRNAVEDVHLVDLSRYWSDGVFELSRISIAAEGTDGDGASRNARFAAFRDGLGYSGGVVRFQTDATNLGAADATPELLLVLKRNHEPTCEIGVPAIAAFGVPFTLDGSQSFDVDEDDGIALYEWDFGDGTAGAEGMTLQYEYAAVGVYTVTLTVTDFAGATNSCTATVQIVVNQPPICSAGPAIAATTTCPAYFDGSGSVELDGFDAIASYAWDFGDGTTATGAIVTHTFATTGVFTVELTVTDTLGVSSSCSTVATVTAIGPTFAFLYQQIAASCEGAACHTGAQAPFLGTQAAAYANMVGVPSFCFGLPYVEPFDPDNSYLVHKLEGTQACGDAMFTLGAYSFMVRCWIAAGALNN
ncbi:MAG: PKD domain-containing protein [Planctomycetota bacterium]